MPTEPPAPGRVALVVDSAATLPEEALASPILHVAPMSLALAGRTYLDGEDVSPSEFYRMLRAAPSPPTTSAPSPATFLDAYRRAARDSASILCLTVASSVSASYESAKVAARLAADALPGVEVRVLDSESAAGGQGSSPWKRTGSRAPAPVSTRRPRRRCGPFPVCGCSPFPTRSTTSGRADGCPESPTRAPRCWA